MTDKRMTDERLAEIQVCWEDTPEWNWEAIAQELIQALKTERDDNTVLRRVNKNHLERISELEAAIQQFGRSDADFEPYLRRISELEAQNKRLTSRGFEDLHDENERLKAKLDRVRGLLDGCDVYVCRPDDGNRLHLITDVLQEAPEQNEALADD